MKILNSKIIGDSEKHIIILHGLFGMGENWNSVALNLSNYGFSIHLVDQRNHGKSFWNDKISYKIMSNDLLEYFNYYKIKNGILIGHSMGGKTAMKFALEFPSKVLKLIVVDISPKKYNPSHKEIIDGLLKINLNKVNSRIEFDNQLLKFIPEIGIRQFLMKNLYRFSENKFALRFNIKTISNKINNYYDEILSDNKYDFEFISCHPLFGPLNNIIGQNIVTIPISSGSLYKNIKAIFNKLGLKITEMKSFQEHDKYMSLIQGMTHFSHVCFTTAMKKLDLDIDKLWIYVAQYIYQIFHFLLE